MGNCGLIGAFSSDTTISTPVAINKGGTGQTTAQAALDALAAASGSLVQGDIFIVDSGGNVVRLARGSDNQSLVMNGSNPNWETAAAGLTQNTQTDQLTSDFTTTNTSLTSTGLALTLSNETDGNATVIVTGHWRNQDAAKDVYGAITDDGTAISNSTRTFQGAAATYTSTTASATFISTDGSVLEWEIYAVGGGTAFQGGGANFTSAMIIKELY